MLLGASGCLWVPLGASGCLWVPLGASGCLWVPLGATGRLWVPLGASGCLWVPLGASGCLWVPLGQDGLCSSVDTRLVVCSMHTCGIASVIRFVFRAFLYGSIGRPDSTNVLCHDKIGRDSWERGGQDSEVNKIPPKNWGKKPSPIKPQAEKNGTSPPLH